MRPGLKEPTQDHSKLCRSKLCGNPTQMTKSCQDAASCTMSGRTDMGRGFRPGPTAAPGTGC